MKCCRHKLQLHSDNSEQFYTLYSLSYILVIAVENEKTPGRGSFHTTYSINWQKVFNGELQIKSVFFSPKYSHTFSRGML